MYLGIRLISTLIKSKLIMNELIMKVFMTIYKWCVHCPTNVKSTYLQNVPWHCSIDSMISILYLLLVWTNNKSYCWQNINWLFFGLSFPPVFCNCITGRWWAVTDHRVWRLIIIYRAYEYVGLSNEYWSTLCILNSDTGKGGE